MRSCFVQNVLVLAALACLVSWSGVSPAFAQEQHALHFDGVDDHVAFGNASNLGLSTFTIEVRFKRTGAGLSTSTGVDGLDDAIPLITKGRGEIDGDNRDMNWFLGVRASDTVLVADFEEGAGQSLPGLNHPIAGTTVIHNDVWYHAAATFDGTTWQLYLNGNLEASQTLGAGHSPQAASIQHAALATAMNSNGTPSGYFQGDLDEPRVWSVARTQAQIQASMDSEILAGSGLVARWGLNEATGALAGSSVVGGPIGFLTGGPTWITDSTLPLSTESGLRFGGTNGYVTFGNAAALELTQFTVETWFRRDGAGTSTSTGAGGVIAIPLVTKGRGEADSPAEDMNWFLGIRASDSLLCADFEEGASGAAPSLNHPLVGVTPIVPGVWHHAAVTYDGNRLRLFLDGSPESELIAGQPPAAAGTQHAALATALNTAGVAEGLFQGALDEVRVWNVARTAAEIVSSINASLSTPTTGLVARWGLNEDAETTVRSSAGTTVDGSIVGTNWSWAAGAPFDLAPPQPPAAPTGLSAVSPLWSRVNLSWTDVADNESAYEIERSTNGSDGPFAPLAVQPPNATSYADTQLTALTQYCYRVRAINPQGTSDWTTPACVTTPAVGNTALAFVTSNAYVTFGDAAALKLGQFTLETWFRRDGNGLTTSTGLGGIDNAIPLVTKGRGEADSPTEDMNYFLGIRASDAVLCADFEEGAAGASPSLNHPLAGVTPIANGVWYHAALTYDGTTLRLYLNGSPESQLIVGQPPAVAGMQHAALASALTTSGTPQGLFQGALDEVRIWSLARTESQITATINTPLDTPVTGLVARWGMNEGSGNTVHSSAGATIDGTILGNQWTWIDGAPFDLAATEPPAAPTDLVASSPIWSRIDLTWTNTATNESSYEVDRSTSGSAGPFTLIAIRPANSTSYSDEGLTATTEYCYRVRAVNAVGPSNYTGAVCATTVAPANTSLLLNGSTAYVRVPDAAGLHLSAFTIETWFRRDGAGIGTDTGVGGIGDAIPLVSKGRAEADAAAVDINYLLGIRASDGVLCADFEEGSSGLAPGTNHPLLGTNPIPLGGWHHGAVTYDGSVFKLYVDGQLESQQTVGQQPASANTSALGLGSALNSQNVAAGFFQGALDEVRIWDHARSQADIQSTINGRLTAQVPGLVARWGIDEGSGNQVTSTAALAATGTIVQPGASWIEGAPLNLGFNQPPQSPALVTPANQSTQESVSPTLSVNVADPDAGDLTVTWYGRALPTAGPDFTLIGLPDTQYYTGELNGGLNAMFQAQTNWIVANRQSRNIPYVIQLGDCTENGQNAGNPIEWERADTSLAILENANTTGLVEGIPYGVCVGNHDQSPNSDPNAASTLFYNQYFGVGRFQNRSYYGGHFGTNNDNWYDFFSASGMDFIVVSFEFDETPDADVLAWADQLLTTYASRRAIVVTHYVTDTGNPAPFSVQSQAIYDALKSHPNFFLMLGGHIWGEGRRQDTFNGHTVHSLLADYQGGANGGNGFLRMLEFSPGQNVIRVRTYSPWLDLYEADADSSSQFTLSYPMSTAEAFQTLGTATVSSGSMASIAWPNLQPNTAYQWYATVSDGSLTTTSPTWSFTTGGSSVGVPLPGPTGLELMGVVPNPAVTGFQVAFTLPREAAARVTLMDLQGREVATLAEGRFPAGRNAVPWRRASGSVQSGVYFVRFQALGTSFVRRVVLMH